MKIFSFLIAGIFPMGILAQSSLHQKFNKISRPEKIWAVTHPFIAKKTFHLTQLVLKVCDSLRHDSSLDGDGNGGQLDAFRHCYWMTVLVQHISPKKAYQLGLAHEKGNKRSYKKKLQEDNSRPDSLGCMMDVVNDQIGIEIGIGNKKSAQILSDLELVELVKARVLDGELRILLKNKSGAFLSCDGEVIDPKLYIGKWAMPKCLVKSNVQKL